MESEAFQSGDEDEAMTSRGVRFVILQPIYCGLTGDWYERATGIMNVM